MSETFLSELERLGVEVRHRLSDGQVQCRCPFHTDRKPSFHFHPDKGIWICFSCGESGNIKKLAEMLHQDSSFIHQPIGYGLQKQEAGKRTELLATAKRLSNDAKSLSRKASRKVWRALDEMMSYLPSDGSDSELNQFRTDLLQEVSNAKVLADATVAPSGTGNLSTQLLRRELFSASP